MFLRCAKFCGWLIAGVILAAYFLIAGGLWVADRVVSRGKIPERAVEAHSVGENSLWLLDSGSLSLVRRLELIAKAKKTIELEFFIYNIDEASRLVTQALIHKADEGVKVRILVDFSAPVFQLKPAYAKILKEHGIEVRYYNTSPIYRIVSAQHRSHRKLLAVDEETIVTGGRNIADEYFDLGKDYDFLDSDVELHGPMVKEVRGTFDIYWNSKLSEAADDVEKKADPKELAKVRSFLGAHAEDAGVLEKLHRQAELVRGRTQPHPCRDLTFVTDFPNQGEANRMVFAQIVKTLAEAKTSIKAESPYFVLRHDGIDVLNEITKRGVKLEVLTNSLHSTDAFYSASALYINLHNLAASGLTLYAFKGTGVPGESPAADMDTRWGLHSKRAVMDGRTVLIGTYNIDPRSANLNSEMLLICKDSPELAQEMLRSWENRRLQSVTLVENGRILPGHQLLQNSTWFQKASFIVALPLANLFDFLL